MPKFVNHNWKEVMADFTSWENENNPVAVEMKGNPQILPQ
jgi:hypothetical protein